MPNQLDRSTALKRLLSFAHQQHARVLQGWTNNARLTDRRIPVDDRVRAKRSLKHFARRSVTTASAALCLFAVYNRAARAEAIQLQSDHDVYRLQVQINGETTYGFILDSGASVVQLPDDLFQSLTRAGIIKADEVRGTSTSTLANGSKVQGYWLVLKSVAVGDTVISNVEADVVPAGSQPLLGQSFLRRLPGWSIDNYRSSLVIEPARWGEATRTSGPIR